MSELPDTLLDRACDHVFVLGVLGAVCFVLWLPVFPTGDGPVHLYYANVLWSLVRHQPGYAQDYAVRHLFAPYLVHYLALISFEQLVSPAMAEKLFMAIIFLTQGFGFRFLARGLGRHAGVACVWMLPLLFSWSLGGGFLNCCFATGVAFWAYGVWVRLDRPQQTSSQTAWWLAAYVALLAVLVLSHPVPLLVLLLFTASDLGLRVAAQLLSRVRRPLMAQAGALLFTGFAFIAPAMLAQKGQAAAVLPEIGFHRDVLAELVTGMRLGYFAGISVRTFSGWLSIALRVLLVGIVPGVALLLGRTQARGAGADEDAEAGAERGWRTLPATPAARLLLISLVYLACTVFFPRSLNHSYFFPQRMWDIVWLLVLACGAAAHVSLRGRLWLASTGAVAVLLLTFNGLPRLVQIARVQERLAEVALPSGGRGLLLSSDTATEERGAATAYPVYFWVGARAFAASHAVLLNSPWLGLTILPVKDAAPAEVRANALLDQGLPAIYSENPVELAHAIGSGGSERRRILDRADFLLYINPADQTGRSSRTAALALLGSDGAAWQCDARTACSLCRRLAR